MRSCTSLATLARRFPQGYAVSAVESPLGLVDAFDIDCRGDLSRVVAPSRPDGSVR